MMLQRLQETILRHARGGTVLVLFCVLAAFLVVLDFSGIPIGLRALTEQSGGLMMLDMRIGYAPDDAYRLLEALGGEGRQLYGIMLLVADVAFPFVYTLFFAIVAAWILRRVFTPNHPALRLVLLPFVGLLADLGENACILAMILAFPGRLDGVAQVANLLTILKFGAGAVGLPVLAVFAGILAWRRIVGRRAVEGERP